MQPGYPQYPLQPSVVTPSTPSKLNATPESLQKQLANLSPENQQLFFAMLRQQQQQQQQMQQMQQQQMHQHLHSYSNNSNSPLGLAQQFASPQPSVPYSQSPLLATPTSPYQAHGPTATLNQHQYQPANPQQLQQQYGALGIVPNSPPHHVLSPVHSANPLESSPLHTSPSSSVHSLQHSTPLQPAPLRSVPPTGQPSPIHSPPLSLALQGGSPTMASPIHPPLLSLASHQGGPPSLSSTATANELQQSQPTLERPREVALTPLQQQEQLAEQQRAVFERQLNERQQQEDEAKRTYTALEIRRRQLLSMSDTERAEDQKKRAEQHKQEESRRRHAEKERLKAEKARGAESERLERARAEQERIESERLAEFLKAEKQERERVAEQERLAHEAKHSTENERLEMERVEQERREEQERLEREKVERDLAEQERLEKEARERVELEREAIEKLAREEREKLERLEQERVAKERERERLENERLERERLAREEQERIEKAEQERVASELAEKQRLAEEKERLEQERLQRELVERKQAEEANRQRELALQRELEEQQRIKQLEHERIAREKSEEQQRLEELRRLERVKIQKRVEEEKLAEQKLEEEAQRLQQQRNAVAFEPLVEQQQSHAKQSREEEEAKKHQLILERKLKWEQEQAQLELQEQSQHQAPPQLQAGSDDHSQHFLNQQQQILFQLSAMQQLTALDPANQSLAPLTTFEAYSAGVAAFEPANAMQDEFAAMLNGLLNAVPFDPSQPNSLDLSASFQPLLNLEQSHDALARDSAIPAPSTLDASQQQQESQPAEAQATPELTAEQLLEQQQREAQEALRQQQQTYLESQCDLDARLYSVSFLMHFKESFTAKPTGWKEAVSRVTREAEASEAREKEARRLEKARAKAEHEAMKRTNGSLRQSEENSAQSGQGEKGRSDVWRPPSRFGETNNNNNSSNNNHSTAQATRTANSAQSHRLNQRGVAGVAHERAPREKEPKIRRDKPEKTEEEQFEITVRTLLSKLTLENFAKIQSEMVNVFKTIRRAHQIDTVAHLIFDRAIAERKFVESYARLCKELYPFSPSVTVKDKVYDFKNALLERVQYYFENKPQLLVIPADATEEEKVLLMEKNVKIKAKRNGNIVFIAALFRKDLLKDRVIGICCKKLLENPSETEHLWQLLSEVGGILDKLSEKWKKKVDEIFEKMEAYCAELNVPPRILYKLEGLKDRRARGWPKNKTL